MMNDDLFSAGAFVRCALLFALPCLAPSPRASARPPDSDSPLRPFVARNGASQNENPAALYSEAQHLFREKKFADSIKMLERLLSLKGHRDAGRGGLPDIKLYAGPPYPEALKLMGLNYVLLDRLDLAEPFLRAAVALSPDDHLSHFHLGLLYYTTSRFAAAAEELREAARLRPSFMKAHDALGLTLEELGEEEAALESYRHAIELGRRQKLADGSPYLNLGRFLMRQNRFAESLAVLREAIRLNPTSAEGFFLSGKALHKLGKDKDAVPSLLEAARHDPLYAEPHYLLSRIYLRQGRGAEAGRELELFHQIRKTRTGSK